MRFLILLAVLTLMACDRDGTGPDASGSRTCTLGDSGAACSQGDSAAIVNGSWRATIHITETENVTYQDGGHLCIRRVIRCVQRTCTFTGNTSMTAAQAIAACRG